MKLGSLAKQATTAKSAKQEEELHKTKTEIKSCSRMRRQLFHFHEVNISRINVDLFV